MNTQIDNDPYSRTNLNEGRDYGIGFSVLEEKAKNHFTPIHPFSACKDYLNDFLYIENTGRELDEIYGFKHEFINYFKNNKKLILGVRSLYYRCNGTEEEDYKWDGYDQSSTFIYNNKENLVMALNFLEHNIFNSNTFLKDVEKNNTKCIGFTNDTIVLELNPIWTKTAFGISFITLFIRCFYNFDKKVTLENILKHTPYIPDDEMMFSNISTTLQNDEEGKYIREKILDKKDYYLKYKDALNNKIHNQGIAYLVSMPKKELI